LPSAGSWLGLLFKDAHIFPIRVGGVIIFENSCKGQYAVETVTILPLNTKQEEIARLERDKKLDRLKVCRCIYCQFRSRSDKVTRFKKRLSDMEEGAKQTKQLKGKSKPVKKEQATTMRLST